MEERIIYQLTTEDAQTVAEEILGRMLTSEELAAIEDKVAENIDWFGAISDAIETTITPEAAPHR